MIPDGGSGVSAPENGEVAGEVSQSKTHGSPVSVLRRYPLAASSANNGECTDTYGYSHTQILSAWRLIRSRAAAGSGYRLESQRKSKRVCTSQIARPSRVSTSQGI